MEKSNKGLKLVIVLLTVLLIVAIAVICVFVFKKDNTNNTEQIADNNEVSQTSLMPIEDADDWEGNKGGYNGKKNTDTIDIPGFDAINFKADTIQQSVNLYNPEANTCYFKMSLILEDGTKLWQSNLIEPGKAVYEITLNQTLSVGTYEKATLKYECFAMDENQTPLNGSEIKLKLNVLE